MSCNRRMARVLALAAAFSATLLASCSEFGEPQNPVLVGTIRLFRTEGSVLSSGSVQTLVGPKEGGEVLLNRHSVTIPPGALKNMTAITISEPNPRFVMADFGPQGTVFDKPVLVTVAYGGLDLGSVDERDLTLYWLNPETATWVDMQGKLDTVEKTVSVWADHFSRYALSDH